MAQGLYVDYQDVAERMQLDVTLDGVPDALNSAIRGAQLHIESVLDSRLDIQSWTSTYFLDSDAFSGLQVGGRFRLEIPSGFVRVNDATRPITVQYAYAGGQQGAQLPPWAAGLYPQGGPPSFSPANPNLYSWDPVRGILFVDASTYADQYIQVTCSTGFVAPDPDVYPPVGGEQIPDWVTEAIIAYVGVVFDATQTTNRDAQAKDIYQRAGDHAIAILAPYIRRKGFLFRPVW